MNNKVKIGILLIAVILFSMPEAMAYSSYLTDPGQFEARYPAASGSKLDQCVLCHINPSGGGPKNPYGNAFGQVHSYSAIENADSDGDGFTNIAEITAIKFPGDAATIQFLLLHQLQHLHQPLRQERRLF